MTDSTPVPSQDSTAETVSDPQPDLTTLTARVIDRRRYETELRDMIAERRMAWESENADLIDQHQRIAKERAAAETDLRDAAIDAYEATGSKKVAPGVGIRVTTVLEYDEYRALNWAQVHDLALQLDKPAFEKIVKASGETLPDLSFVAVLTVPTATIAADLETVVAQAGTEAAS